MLSRPWKANSAASWRNSATKSRPTPIPARRSNGTLGRSAAEQGRSNIGRDHHLLGRFLRRHLRTGHRRRAGWWIDQAAVLDDFLYLDSIEGLVFEQSFRDNFQFVAVRGEHLLRVLISVVDKLAHFPVDLLGGRFAVIARARNVAAEENVIFVFAVLDHPHFLAHA